MPRLAIELTEAQLDAMYTHAVLMCLRYTDHEPQPALRAMWHLTHQAAADLGAVARSSTHTITYDAHTGRRHVRYRAWDDE
jgi:hypothetical protein